MKLNAYEQKLLEGWEEVFKKGQLTLWIMLALKDSPKHMAEIKQYISQTTLGSLEADDQSMYRALRRYHDAELVGFRTSPGKNGPDLKIYYIEELGLRVLNTFIKRNILDVFFQPKVRKLLEANHQN